MPEVRSHKQGMPSWVELATTDEQAAMKFYSALFGWKYNPQPMGPGAFYHMQQLKGLDVGAITPPSQTGSILASFKDVLKVTLTGSTSGKFSLISTKLTTNSPGPFRRLW